LAKAGWAAEQIMRAAGVRVPGDGDGGRIPDLTVWSQPQPPGVWLAITDLLLVVEIVSTGSRSLDKDTKRHEHVAAGIPRYRVVDRDSAQTVTLHRLGADRTYEAAAKMP
jgi:Uma2 family endonuclease